MEKATDSFQQLVDIMAQLRSPRGCPWDKEQTIDTIKGHLIEETYEVIEAINNKDFNELKIELGDLLLQIIFHSQLAKEQSKFDICDVIKSINQKLIRRHPHIFAGQEAGSTKDVLRRWEEIKKDEKGNKKPSYLDGVPVSLPALSFSQRLQTKAARVGFDWEELAPALEKLEEEIIEFKDSVKENNYSLMEKELGDLLFSAVNVARKNHIDAESALIKASNIFTGRFRKMEELAGKTGNDFAKLSLADKELLWQKAKLADGK